jgi:hypothetical protein
MRRPKLAASAVLLLGLCAAAPPPEEGPRALVRRAVRAVHGEADLPDLPALRRKIKGGHRPVGAPGGASTFTGEIVTGPGGMPYRATLNMNLGGARLSAVTVLDGKRSWRSMAGGPPQPLSASEQEHTRASVHSDRVIRLVDLLRDRGFILTALPDGKVDGRDAQGVKVSYRGQPDVSLYFDRASGLLVKYAYRHKAPGPFGGVLEVTLRDYREVCTGAAEERLLRAAKVPTDRGLLRWLREQTPDPERRKKLRELIRRLGDDEFAVREKAEADLKAAGAPALPLLREAARSADPEVATRARRCLAALGPAKKREGPTVAAVRLLAVRRPAGAVEALLAVLPGADEKLTAEVRAALAALAGPAGRHPALQAALKDAHPARRAAAAAVLGKDGGAYLRQPGRRLYPRGLRQAMKQVQVTGGKMEMEMEVLEVECFNRFADKEFARPPWPTP